MAEVSFQLSNLNPTKTLLWFSWFTTSTSRILFAMEAQQVSKQPNQIVIYRTGSYINYSKWFEKGITIIQLVKQHSNFFHLRNNLEISYIRNKSKKKYKSLFIKQIGYNAIVSKKH